SPTGEQQSVTARMPWTRLSDHGTQASEKEVAGSGKRVAGRGDMGFGIRLFLLPASSGCFPLLSTCHSEERSDEESTQGRPPLQSLSGQAARRGVCLHLARRSRSLAPLGMTTASPSCLLLPATCFPLLSRIPIHVENEINRSSGCIEHFDCARSV